MYNNLKAEMVRKGLKASDCAKVIGLRYDAFTRRLRGEVPFLLVEALKLHEDVFPDVDFNYLFQPNGKA
jgi:hypothetical protein